MQWLANAPLQYFMWALLLFKEDEIVQSVNLMEQITQDLSDVGDILVNKVMEKFTGFLRVEMINGSITGIVEFKNKRGGGV